MVSNDCVCCTLWMGWGDGLCWGLEGVREEDLGGYVRKRRFGYAKMSLWEGLAREGVVKKGRCRYKTEGGLSGERAC